MKPRGEKKIPYKFAPIPSDAFGLLSHEAVAVLGAIAKHTLDEYTPGQREIKHDARCSWETLARALKELQDHGILEVRKTRHRSRYVIHPPERWTSKPILWKDKRKLRSETEHPSIDDAQQPKCDKCGSDEGTCNCYDVF